jgi:hypothetical protein
MSDCQRCAALRMIAEDQTLSHAEIVQLAMDALSSQPPCGRPAEQFTRADYEKVASIQDPHYDPEDPDNPMLDILLPSMLKKQVQL